MNFWTRIGTRGKYSHLKAEILIRVLKGRHRTVTGIADLIGVHRASCSRALKDLVKGGLIERDVFGYMVVTENGQKAIDDLYDILISRKETSISDFTKTQKLLGLLSDE